MCPPAKNYILVLILVLEPMNMIFFGNRVFGLRCHLDASLSKEIQEDRRCRDISRGRGGREVEKRHRKVLTNKDQDVTQITFPLCDFPLVIRSLAVKKDST